jgi:hypothetical protein
MRIVTASTFSFSLALSLVCGVAAFASAEEGTAAPSLGGTRTFKKVTFTPQASGFLAGSAALPRHCGMPVMPADPSADAAMVKALPPQALANSAKRVVPPSVCAEPDAVKARVVPARDRSVISRATLQAPDAKLQASGTSRDQRVRRVSAEARSRRLDAVLDAWSPEPGASLKQTSVVSPVGRRYHRGVRGGVRGHHQGSRPRRASGDRCRTP